MVSGAKRKPRLFRKLRHFLRLRIRNNYLWTWKAGRCFSCGGRCHTIEVNFEGYLHRFICEDVENTLYWSW